MRKTGNKKSTLSIGACNPQSQGTATDKYGRPINVGAIVDLMDDEDFHAAVVECVRGNKILARDIQPNTNGKLPRQDSFSFAAAREVIVLADSANGLPPLASRCLNLKRAILEIEAELNSIAERYGHNPVVKENTERALEVICRSDGNAAIDFMFDVFLVQDPAEGGDN